MLEFSVEDMTCTDCASTIIEAIKSVAPDASVEVDLKDRLVRVDSEAAAEDIEAAIEEVGYTPVTAPPEDY
ncbi:MAG TPA: heavy-metal-associated domain-containing protein [Rhodocyclaceae bacterium]|nr:heavy-metal-associated domain-containing protein [Rhodocyclaceae bacterium]